MCYHRPGCSESQVPPALFPIYTPLDPKLKPQPVPLVYLLRLSRNLSLPSLYKPTSTSIPQELANSTASLDSDSSNHKLVLKLYEALSSGDSDTVVKLVAPDLEWWFHGPPSDQYLMRMLTGEHSSDTFRFVPLSIASFGPIVIVEGCDNSRSISWIHAWTVTDGIITQIREYFNTSLTVTRIGDSSSSPESEITAVEDEYPSCVWESSLSRRVGKSVPGLVLAI